MSFKRFDFRCKTCDNVEDRIVRSAEIDEQVCECGGSMKRLLAAPPLDIGRMAAAGCPGAYETVGDRLERQHRKVDQHHRKAGS